MWSFNNSPIKQKLAFVILLTNILTLGFAWVGFMGYEIFFGRQRLKNDVASLSRVVATSGSAALLFRDEEVAYKALEALQVRPGINKAAFYDSKGALFVYYPRDLSPSDFPLAPGSMGLTFDAKAVTSFHPVVARDRPVGVFFIESSQKLLYQTIRQFALIAGTILFLAIIASYAFSAAIQTRIASPLLELANTAKVVSEKKDFSLRVMPRSRDELGILAESFNQMLLQIQERDHALNRVNQELERRVQDRTKLLQESEERFRKVFEEGPMGMAFVDRSLHFMGVNNALCYMLSYAPEELIGKRFPDLAQPEDALVDLNFWELLYRGEIPNYQNKKRFLTRNGQVIWTSFNASVVRDKLGKPLYGLCLLENITEQKKAEEEIRELNATLERRVEERTQQLQEVVQELEAFSYSVSHDLRAPLRAIDGFSRVLVEDYGVNIDEEGKRLLNVILRNTRNMGRLIDDLLAFSRLGRQEVKRVPIDMEKLGQSVYEDLKTPESERRLTFELKDLPMGQGDPAMIRQVVINLVANAIKFTKPIPNAIVTFGGRQDEKENVYYVKDNGVGFEMEFVHKLFGVFQRLHTVEKFEGTGVGLAIVRRIIQRHGGRVWAESKSNQGATFYFTLPRIEERNLS